MNGKLISASARSSMQNGKQSPARLGRAKLVLRNHATRSLLDEPIYRLARIAAMQPFDNCAAWACMQAWRLASSLMTAPQSRWASPRQAAVTAALTASAGPDKAKQIIAAAEARRIMGAPSRNN
jgi:hypothetical protein